MDSITPNLDALDREIASTELAIRTGQQELEEIEKAMAERKKKVEGLQLEVNILKRAASLRPAASLSPVQPKAD